jgi:transposase
MSENSAEHRSVIKFLWREGNEPKNIQQRMIIVYQEDAPSYFTIKFWSKQFRRSRESIQGDPRCGRPVEARTNENIKKVEVLVSVNRRIEF